MERECQKESGREMTRVICVVDKVGTALDRLAKGVIPYHDNLDYHVVDVHPKRPSQEQLQKFEDLARSADVIDYQYYRTADMLRDRYAWLKDIPSVLTHNNPYAIHERDWNDYDVVVGNNREIHKNLKEITTSRVEYIPLVVDPLFWKFNDEYKFEKSVIMVANRIEAKKGILPVAKACKEMEIKMYLVGAISDPGYWQEVMATQVVEYAQEVSDELLRDLYYKAGIHVCNSVDNFESGTLPVLESIFCGVPVLSRPVGHVPDIKDGENIVVNNSDPEDIDSLTTLLTQMFADKKRLEDQRHEAWFSIKDRNFERRAYTYQRLYRELVSEAKPVTVVVPVAEKPEVTSKCINAILSQTYPNLEVIVVDDGEVKQRETVELLQKTCNIPFRYVSIDEPGYNLAKARNIGAIEATSDILVFADQRMILEPNCIEEFVKELKPHHWLYGSKGVKKDFVENLSCINRDDFFTLGMFNEHIQQYGGMSQECRSRARRQGFNTYYVESAKAHPEGKSSNKRRKKYEIMASKNMLWKAGLQ